MMESSNQTQNPTVELEQEEVIYSEPISFYDQTSSREPIKKSSQKVTIDLIVINYKQN